MRLYWLLPLMLGQVEIIPQRCRRAFARQVWHLEGLLVKVEIVASSRSVTRYLDVGGPRSFHVDLASGFILFNDFLNTIFFSSPTVALIVAIFLDNTVDYKEMARDRGMPWPFFLGAQVRSMHTTIPAAQQPLPVALCFVDDRSTP
ncbi:hypothetical protein Ddye_001333 [Dipteronia dyeriana]|uniref:Uncharacterized protein n=1 Tax=Dipteronia dyeriana TaxID=168575 RepID=A0AAD9XNA5_9ROSI|nr:hypothetical protein Ddye_001333 [Dipteronia dyeriana]